MDKRVIVCISREYGSGGRVVGENLARILGIPFYDKTLLTKTALEHGISEEIIEGVDEQPANWLSRGFPMGIRNPYKVDFYDSVYYALNDKVFYMTSRTIKAIAEEGSCVIVGRVADEVLKDDPDRVSIFIHADKKVRIKRIMAIENVDEQKAEQMIRKTDKNRANYYNFYANKRWGECASYDLSISTSRFGIDRVVQDILKAIE